MEGLLEVEGSGRRAGSRGAAGEIGARACSCATAGAPAWTAGCSLALLGGLLVLALRAGREPLPLLRRPGSAGGVPSRRLRNETRHGAVPEPADATPPGSIGGDRGSRLGSGARRGAATPVLTPFLLDRFIVVPEHRLLFCYMEKVGGMSFNVLFRNLRRRYDSRMNITHPWFLNTPKRHSVSKKGLEQILADPTWHKAVFYREPMERFLSAYISKCEQHDPDGKYHCMEQFRKFPIGFAEAVEAMTNRSYKKGGNVHFLPQKDFCGNLARTLQFYDTVEELSRETSRDKVEKLLQKVGVDPQTVPKFDKIYPPPGQEAAVTKHSHDTAAGKRFFEYFGTVRIDSFRRLEDYFKGDYDLFHLKRPCA